MCMCLSVCICTMCGDKPSDIRATLDPPELVIGSCNHYDAENFNSSICS